MIHDRSNLLLLRPNSISLVMNDCIFVFMLIDPELVCWVSVVGFRRSRRLSRVVLFVASNVVS